MAAPPVSAREHPQKQIRRRPVVRDAALAALVTLLWLGALEVGLHAFGPRAGSFFRFDDVRYFTFRPRAEGWYSEEGGHHVRINSQGFPDRERSYARSSSALRIAVVGDSQVASLQVPQQKTFLSLMERSLRGHGDAEVLNLGVNAYSLAQQYLVLRDEVPRYDPQIVIVMFSLGPTLFRSVREGNALVPFPYFSLAGGRLTGPARPAPLVQDGRPDYETGWMSPTTLSDATRNRLNHWQLYLLALAEHDELRDRYLRRWGPVRNPIDVGSDWSHAPSTPDTVLAWRISEEILKEMDRLSRSRGTEFWIATFGPNLVADTEIRNRQDFMTKGGLSSLDYSDRRMNSFLAGAGIRHIDLNPEMIRAADRGVRLYRTVHWNLAGHEMASRLILDELRNGSPQLHDWLAQGDRDRRN